MWNPLPCLHIKNRVSRTACLAVIVFLLVVLNACDRQTHSSIRFGLNTAPITLDPRYITDAISERISRLIYRRLTDFDAGYQVVSDLADWQQLSGTHYRFNLGQEGREFHHGRRLTAHDVEQTYLSILDGQNASPHRATLEHIIKIQVVNDDTIDFYLSRPDVFFPGRLNIGIMPADLLQTAHTFNNRPIGSGPLKYLQWKYENELRLQRLSDQTLIEFITVKDPTVRVLKLARGEIDLLQGNLSQEDLIWLRRQKHLKIHQIRGDVFTYIGFNLEDSFTGKLDVRRAIAHAIDRDAIIKYVMGKSARKAGALLPPEHWAGHKQLQGYSYKPERSRQLLAQSGYDHSNPLQLIFKTSSDPFRIRLATIIQHQLKQVGINMKIQSFDWGTFYGDIKQGRFQLYSLSWVGLKLPDIFRHIFHSDSVPPKGANRGRFRDGQIDQLIEAASHGGDIQNRQQLYTELQQRLHELLPYIPLWYEDTILVHTNNVNGYRPSSDGNYDGMIHVQKIHQP